MSDTPVRTAFALRTEVPDTLFIKTMEENTKEYDYNTPVELTSVELAKMVLAKLDEVKDKVIVENFEKQTPEKRRAFTEAHIDLGIDIIKEIAKTDIPYLHASICIDKITFILQLIKQQIDRKASNIIDEIVARHVGVRDPDKNKFRIEPATFGQIMLKLDETIKSTGNNPYDWYDDPVKNDGPAGVTPAQPQV